MYLIVSWSHEDVGILDTSVDIKDVLICNKIHVANPDLSHEDVDILDTSVNIKDDKMFWNRKKQKKDF